MLTCLYVLLSLYYQIKLHAPVTPKFKTIFFQTNKINWVKLLSFYFLCNIWDILFKIYYAYFFLHCWNVNDIILDSSSVIFFFTDLLFLLVQKKPNPIIKQQQPVFFFSKMRTLRNGLWAMKWTCRMKNLVSVTVSHKVVSGFQCTRTGFSNTCRQSRP